MFRKLLAGFGRVACDLKQLLVAQQPLARIEAVQSWSDPGALRSLREMLLKSERPFVIAGGGGSPRAPPCRPW